MKRRWQSLLRSTAFCLFTLLLPAPAGAAPGDCGTVIIPLNADVESFNPMLTPTDSASTIAGLMYQGLIWINRFQQIDWSRSLASAITTPDSGLTFQVTLRPWIWSDGAPVTTADVAYTLRQIQQWNYGTVGGVPGMVKSFTVRDATHFDIVLTHRVNPQWFIYNGLTQLVPLPAHDWARYNLDQLWQMQSTPAFFKIVDGPLALRRLDIDQEAVMVPNPAYPGPKPHFQQLILRFMHGDGIAVRMAETGELDIAPLPMALWKIARNLPGVHVEFLDPRATYYHIFLNFQNPAVAFFRDLRVRQAIEDAIDRQAMINLLFHGHGTPVLAPLSPSQWLFLPPALRQGHYPAGYNPARAAQLLAQAGFVRGPDGIMAKSGKKLSFTTLIPGGSDQNEMMGEILAGQLRAAGIEMRLQVLDISQVEAKLNGGGSGWQAAYMYRSVQAYPTGEADFATNGVINPGGYSDPEMDRLIDASINEPGLAGLYAYEDYASAQVPVVFDITAPNAVLVRNRLHGVNDFYDPAGQLAPEQLTCTDTN
jgi:peptide/nickel transport system substrate-binding protein